MNNSGSADPVARYWTRLGLKSSARTGFECFFNFATVHRVASDPWMMRFGSQSVTEPSSKPPATNPNYMTASSRPPWHS